MLQGGWGPGFGRKKGGRGGGRKGSKQAEPTEEELQAMAEDLEAEALENDGDGECPDVTLKVGFLP